MAGIGDVNTTTSGRWSTQPPGRCPDGHESPPRPGARRSCRLPGARGGWSYDLALPGLSAD
jgi:hypothetical protein